MPHWQGLTTGCSPAPAMSADTSSTSFALITDLGAAPTKNEEQLEGTFCRVIVGKRVTCGRARRRWWRADDCGCGRRSMSLSAAATWGCRPECMLFV
jgi:hypothetical protein